AAPCWRGRSLTEVEGAGGDPLGRPTGQVQPAVGAHEEHTYGRLVTDSVGHAFQPIIEPPQTQRVQVNRRFRTKVQLSNLSRAGCRWTMYPGPDDQPLPHATAFATPTLVNALEASD